MHASKGYHQHSCPVRDHRMVGQLPSRDDRMIALAPARIPFEPPVATSGRHASKVVIIGAGPGGLASALLLAQAGIKVHVIERLPRVGGRCSALEQDGFRFDLGPTFFLYPLVLERIFKLIGATYIPKFRWCGSTPNIGLPSERAERSTAHRTCRGSKRRLRRSIPPTHRTSNDS